MPILVHSSRRQESLAGQLSDRALMSSIGAGDDGAFEELIRRKTAPLIQLVARIVGEREEARDIVQIVFLRVWEKRRKYDDRWSPNTWIYRIAVNLAIDQVRARRVRERALRPLAAQLRRIEGGRPRGLAELEHRELAAVFQRLAAELTDRQRLVFLLAAVEGLPAAEVGSILGCKASTVRNHLVAARRRLRAELRRLYPEYALRGGRRDAGPEEDS